MIAILATLAFVAAWNIAPMFMLFALPIPLRHKLRGGFETAHPAPGLRIDSVLGHLVASGCGSLQSGPPRRQTPER